MPNGTFVLNKAYTFQESAYLLARAISSITEQNEASIFSMADIQCLLRSVNEYVPGEFEIRQTYSHYYEIVYRFEDEVIEGFKKKWEGFTE